MLVGRVPEYNRELDNATAGVFEAIFDNKCGIARVGLG